MSTGHIAQGADVGYAAVDTKGKPFEDSCSSFFYPGSILVSQRHHLSLPGNAPIARRAATLQCGYYVGSLMSMRVHSQR